MGFEPRTTNVSRAGNIRAWVRVSTADIAISSGQEMSAW